MLILTRRVGESLKIGDEVEITALGAQRGQVRIGITAPRHISVHRTEVYERLKGAMLAGELQAEEKNKVISTPECAGTK